MAYLGEESRFGEWGTKIPIKRGGAGGREVNRSKLNEELTNK